jgi:hypothetical protein
MKTRRGVTPLKKGEWTVESIRAVAQIPLRAQKVLSSLRIEHGNWRRCRSPRGVISQKNTANLDTVVTYLGLDRPYRCYSPRASDKTPNM